MADSTEAVSAPAVAPWFAMFAPLIRALCWIPKGLAGYFILLPIRDMVHDLAGRKTELHLSVGIQLGIAATVTVSIVGVLQLFSKLRAQGRELQGLRVRVSGLQQDLLNCQNAQGAGGAP